MRFHALGLPHTITSSEYVACAYTQKVLKFCKMMSRRGHQVFHYGHERSEVDAERVTVTDDLILKAAYGDHDWRTNGFKFDVADVAYRAFYANAIIEIAKRKREGDFLLCFFGHGHRPIADAHQDMIVVEPGIGYAGGHFAPFKVFESYAILHAYGGLGAVGQCRQSFNDVVIPNYFDPEEFTFDPKAKRDYFLFMGRVYDGKGVDIAIEVTKAIDAKLIVAGQNGAAYPGGFPPHVEYVGYADREKRRALMAGAIASFLPTRYIEPFGGVQVENLLSGTPTITTDWGAFAENNLHGVTGFRCRTFDHFCWAAENIGQIQNAACRAVGMRFTLDAIAPMYEDFFTQASDPGWKTRHPERTSIPMPSLVSMKRSN